MMGSKTVFVDNYKLTELDTASEERKYRLISSNTDIMINETTEEFLQYLKKHEGRSSSEIIAGYTENHSVSSELIRNLLDTLFEKGVLLEKSPEMRPDQDAKRDQLSSRGEMKNLWFRKKLIDTDKYTWLLKKLGFTFSKTFFVTSVLTFLVLDACFFYSIYFSSWGSGLRYYSYFDYLFFLPLGWFLVFVHELGHTVATKIHDLPMPKGIGVGLYYFMIVFYADTHETWSLSRKERAIVSTAGVYWNFLALALLIPVFFYTGSGVLKDFILLNHVSFLSIFNPFLKMDGYWLLSDLLGVVNLHKKVRSYFKISLAGEENKEMWTKPLKGYPQWIKYSVIAYGLVYFVFLGIFLGFFLYRAGLITVGFETRVLGKLLAIFQISEAGLETKFQTVNGLIRNLAVLTGAAVLLITGGHKVWLHSKNLLSDDRFAKIFPSS